MNKTKMYSMRFNPNELERIQKNAEKAKQSVTAYITNSALNRKIVVIDGLDKVLHELKGIGRNLNQLTTLCNMGKITALDLTEIKKCFGAVFDYLYDISEKGIITSRCTICRRKL